MSSINLKPKNWIELTVNDALKEGIIEKPLDGNHGEIHPKGDDFISEGVPFIMASDLKNGKVDLINCSFIRKKQADSLRKGFAKNGDVLLSHKATIGRVALVKTELEYIVLTPQVTYYRVKDYSKLNNIFLKYYFQNDVFQKILFSYAGGGSTRAYIGITSQLDLPLILPSISEQISIVEILTAFDNKIELLKAQNKTLEETAQIIFAEWFNKYINGEELPKGWKIESLEKIANHSKTNIKPFDNPDVEYYHYSLPSYDNGLIPVIEKGKMIKSNKYLVENNSFLVSKLNPFTPRIWTVFDANQNFICSTEFQVVKPKEELYFSLIHCFLNSNEFTSELSQKIKGTSSSHQRVNPQDIFDVELVIPSENDLINFNSVIYPLISKKNINHKQIQTLSQTRDELLPRLMTGEVRVKM